MLLHYPKDRQTSRKYQMRSKSLKTNIIFNVAFLLMAGMLSITFVATSFFENSIIKADVSKLHAIIEMAGDRVEELNTFSKADIQTKEYLLQILKTFDIQAIHFMDQSKSLFFTSDSKIDSYFNQIQTYTHKAINEKIQFIHFYGETAGIFWMNKNYLSVSFSPNKNIGISTVVSLAPVYASFRGNQKKILFYIVLNTILLSFIGLIRFSKIFIYPVKKLTDLAKKYDGKDDALYMLQSAENEFGILSTSLNSMLSRISNDKNKLENTINELKRSNNELKKAQTEIIRAEKMASIGRLSAGIAHEIGNPIGIIIGYIELMKQKNISEKERIEFLDRSENEIHRIDRIIKRLLNLSKKSEILHHPISIHQIIRETMELLKVQPVSSTITLESRLNATNDIVIADHDQLKQVFINVVLNSIDAILSKKIDNGLIIISTDDIHSESGSMLNCDSFLKVQISDNGPGIFEKKPDKIFDPFYTTKETGAGTGLGLYVCYMIIEELNGFIRAESKQNEGATIIIGLPVKKE